MDISEIYTKFCNDLGISPENINTDKNAVEFEDFLPDIIKIVQKDVTFFSTPKIVFNTDLSSLPEDKREIIWNNLLPCILVSFLHGDIKTKSKKIIDVVKNIWNSQSNENDEIGKILNDESTDGKFKEIIDYVCNSRIVKIIMEKASTFDVSEFNISIDNPAEIIEMIKDKENPTMKKLVSKIHDMIQESVRNGEINQQMLTREIEVIKSKVMSLFGSAIGGGNRGLTSSVMMGNSPEARRQRMIARLQRKVNDKNSK